MKALVSRYKYFVNKTCCLHNIVIVIVIAVVVWAVFKIFLTVKVRGGF